ncbi:alkene reductase [Thiohalobacter sp.]|uniref:alkene reductase n=1 Tax=Thiohalobacter sp. TaxID=2025948 RepID=UPI002637FF3A|nr:alkene reductase [Thiohalobacter sp.]
MDSQRLFSHYSLPGGLTLKNRIVMAPMTRCFAADGLVPTEGAQAYYGARADAGLIVTEATLVDPRAQGYPRTPGIFAASQVDAWHRITDVVHARDGLIFCQLWHTGRMAHSHYTGCQPVAPSAVALDGPLPRAPDLRYETPRELTTGEIAELADRFADAARNALRAGFDGVEIHGANGYLIDQFLHQQTNRREDDYGGSPQNRARFPLQVVDAVAAAVGSQRTAIRLSPQAYVNLDHTPGDEAAFDWLLPELGRRQLAYVHVAAFDADQRYDYLGGRPVDYVRHRYPGTVVGCGGFTPARAEAELAQNRMDLVAFGRSFIANPDLVARAHADEALAPYDESMLGSLA